jgi:CubicO group peptidase (beta-lactamase class C family)
VIEQSRSARDDPGGPRLDFARRWLGRCRIPRQLGDVVSVAEEAPAREVGIAQRELEEIWRSVEALYRTGVHPASGLCIRHRGAVLLDRAIGHVSGNAPEDPPDAERVPVSTDTPFCLFSAAKAVHAMVIHKLCEQGLLHLEDRVSDYVPEFARYGKRHITIRHLLSHRAGIPNLPPEALELDLLAQPERVVEILAEMRPRTRPGRLLAYHAVSGGFVLAEVARRVSGQDVRTLLRKEIAEPLGWRWMSFGVRPEHVPLVARNALTGPPPPPPISGLLRNALGTDLAHVVELSNDPRFVTGILPSGNAMSTANELSAFFQCLLDEGELGGVRVFDPRTVHRATSEQSIWELDLTLGVPLRYGLGFMLGGPVSVFGWDTPSAFGHLGLSNIIGWADPRRRLAVGLVNSGKPVVSVHVVRLVQLLVRIARAFPRAD